MTEVKEKSTALAIGLNLLLPGLGYIYLGKWLIGVVGGLLIIVIMLNSGLLFLLQTWIAMNVIMAIDMAILSNKRKKEIEINSTKKCPKCAELIKKDASVCKHCGAEVTQV